MTLSQPNFKIGKNALVTTTTGSYSTLNDAKAIQAQLNTPGTAPGVNWIALTLADGSTRVVDSSTISAVSGS